MSVTFLQSNSKNAGVNASATQAFSKTVQKGSFIYVGVFCAAGGTTCTVTDSNGNTYTEIDHADSGSNSLYHFGAKNVIGSYNMVLTVTQGSSVTLRWCQAEYAGVDTVNPVTLFTQGSGTGSNTTVGPLVATKIYPVAICTTRTSVTGTFTGAGNTPNLRDSTPGSPLIAIADGITSDLIGTSETGGFTLDTAPTWQTVFALLNPYQTALEWVKG